MQEQTRYQDILELLDSKAQADEFVNQLNDLNEHLFNKDIDVLKKIKTTMPILKSERIINLIQNNGINLNDTIRIQTLLQDIKDVILSIPIVNITVPFEPKDDDLKRMTAWFNVNFQTKMFPKLTFDSSLIGGAAIGFKGNYTEFTLVKALENLYETGELNRLIAANIKR
jgi:F0F1-type ATP synthase delta subunit